MKKPFFAAFLCFCLNQIQAKDEDFIDDIEYGKNLYENPRGISCQKCHGNNGEGTIIASYKNRGKNKKLVAPQINQLSLEKFVQNINKGKGVMPKYYLTQKEILAIYKYLKSIRSPQQ